MHRCNPDDTTPCNAWCHGTRHVDLAYCDTALLTAFGQEGALHAFRLIHAHRHHEEYHTPACTILALAPAPEAPPMPRRYPQYGVVGEVTAFRITYVVGEEEACF
jgi:hypothetical protein